MRTVTILLQLTFAILRAAGVAALRLACRALPIAGSRVAPGAAAQPGAEHCEGV